jgi:hypothetical protein
MDSSGIRGSFSLLRLPGLGSGSSIRYNFFFSCSSLDLTRSGKILEFALPRKQSLVTQSKGKTRETDKNYKPLLSFKMRQNLENRKEIFLQSLQYINNNTDRKTTIPHQPNSPHEKRDDREKYKKVSLTRERNTKRISCPLQQRHI